MEGSEGKGGEEGSSLGSEDGLRRDVVSELFELDSRAANLAPVWLKGPFGDMKPLFVLVHLTAAGVSLYLCLFGAASPPPAAASCADIRVWLRRCCHTFPPAFLLYLESAPPSQTPL